MNRTKFSAILFLAAFALAIVSSSVATATPGEGLTDSPAQASERYIGQPDAIRAGEKLFRQHCAECHGTNARGIGKAANLRSGRIRAKSPEELVTFLRSGNMWKGMPSWSGLPEQRRWQIVAYLKSLR